MAPHGITYAQLCNHIACALRASGLLLDPFIVERQATGGGGEQVVFARFGVPSLNAEVWCSELHAVYENARNTANFKKMLSLRCVYLPLHFKRILLTILTCPPHI